MYCTKECFEQAVALMDEFDTGLHTHSSESIWEVEESLKRWGRRPIEVFHDRGILGPRTVVAHAVWLSDREIELLAQTGTSVAHCPTSNMKLASGAARVGDLRRAGVKVGIGSDGEKENNNLDLVEEMKVASLLQKVTTLDPTTGDPWDVIRQATLEGAAALGLDAVTGSLGGRQARRHRHHLARRPAHHAGHARRPVQRRRAHRVLGNGSRRPRRLDRRAAGGLERKPADVRRRERPRRRAGRRRGVIRAQSQAQRHMNGRDDAMARAAWHRLEPVNAVTYFAPECRAAHAQLGLRGFWMGYFAGRAAPMGAVAPGVVEAVFFNFHPAMVRRAIPDAWARATPDAVVSERSAAAAGALRRLARDADAVGNDLLALLERAIDHADGAGRPLFAANRDLAHSLTEVEGLWQATTTLREHRGDSHVAILTEAAIGGCEAHVLFAATESVAPEVLRDNRGWSADDWDAATDQLRRASLGRTRDHAGDRCRTSVARSHRTAHGRDRVATLRGTERHGDGAAPGSRVGARRARRGIRRDPFPQPDGPPAPDAELGEETQRVDHPLGTFEIHEHAVAQHAVEPSPTEHGGGVLARRLDQRNAAGDFAHFARDELLRAFEHRRRRIDDRHAIAGARQGNALVARPTTDVDHATRGRRQVLPEMRVDHVGAHAARNDP